MDSVHRYFATTVGLITTRGSRIGPNVMAAEWTMQISYDPMLVAIFVHDSPTYRNMMECRVFGVNIASENQAELVNVAGGYSGVELQKLAIPGLFRTYKAARIDVPMVSDCVLNAECKVMTTRRLGDHIMVVGRVVTAKFDEEKSPLIYTRGNYRKLSIKIPSGRRTVQIGSSQMARFQRMASGQFVLKVAAAVIKKDRTFLLQRFGKCWILPATTVKKGQNYAETLERHLGSLGVCAEVQKIKRLER
ncbi:MAG: flavin reductase family protein, partial [Nitrososphaera sp.]|nr:flavin reductase family protein [Nitrososphaera sp.]